VAAISSAPVRYAQVGLTADQVDELATFFLASQPPGICDPTIELQDPENEHRKLHAAWTRKGTA
jgi:hypothetical protein